MQKYQELRLVSLKNQTSSLSTTLLKLGVSLQKYLLAILLRPFLTTAYTRLTKILLATLQPRVTYLRLQTIRQNCLKDCQRLATTPKVITTTYQKGIKLLSLVYLNYRQIRHFLEAYVAARRHLRREYTIASQIY